MSTQAEKDEVNEWIGFIPPKALKIDMSVTPEEKQGLTDNALIHHGEVTITPNTVATGGEGVIYNFSINRFENAIKMDNGSTVKYAQTRGIEQVCKSVLGKL